MSDCKSKETPLFDALPSCTDIVPADCGEAFINSCTFELDGAELGLFDCIAEEHTNIIGTEIEFFHLSIVDTIRDPLYDEPVQRVFDGSYKLKAFLEYPEADVEAREHGIKKMFDAELWIPRVSLEKQGAPSPVENDIIRVWNNPYFSKYSVLDQTIPSSGYFFNIIKVAEDGHIFDQASFVGFKCTLKRNTEYTPERKLIND